MKSFNSIRFIVFIIIIAGIYGAYRVSSKPQEHGMSLTHNQTAGPAYLKKNADELKGTIVTPHMEQKIVPGKNVLWCSTFQLAWNELCDLGGGSVKLKLDSSMADILSKRGASKADIDDASYVAVAGFAEDGSVEKIRQELKTKFNGQESPDLLNRLAPKSGFIAYGYLFKSLPFEWAFDRFSDKLTFQDKKVECFGVEQYLPEDEPREARSGKQISILDYKDQDDFIIELKTLQKKDHLILAKIKPLETLDQTVRSVMNRMKNGRPVDFTDSADMYIPVLDFDLLKDYSELKRIIQSSNKRLNGQPIEVALQSIRFRLDETGAVLKSEAIMVACLSRTNLVFDKPFLVLLQRDSAKNPYFALWVGNTELLLPGGAGKTPKQRSFSETYK
ncbi:hypothetical protein [uncultured Desulfobulbus sp.]|uniref:hypothetical protein n=1 Tax=uncultured Desulfobulbus sp. TaxID=239745 RepID=UPI0029C94B67|nr:hypothetical protein [uncultured Desulfobulbus sp.]